MRIVMGAQASGFGPVAKLVAIAKLIVHDEKLFIGNDIALQFARQNYRCFREVVECEPEFLPQIQRRIVGCDIGVVVMHHELAFWVAVYQRPLYFFDSLLGFWVLQHEMRALQQAAAQIRRMPPAEAHAFFHAFSVHERKVICHFLATRSFAQNFAGVPERVAEIERCCHHRIAIIGSIIDARVAVPAGVAGEDRWEMLINLGGVKNFVLNFHENDYYIDVVERWARDFLSRRPDCYRIMICCGRYVDHRTEQIGHGWLERRFLSHDSFIEAIQRVSVYLSSPGLTAINEAIQLGLLPVLLPEQHYSQVYNLRALRRKRVGGWSLSLDDLFESYTIPDDDFEGSQWVIESMRQVVDSPVLYARFFELLCDRVDRMRAAQGAAKAEALAEMRDMVAGTELGVVVGQFLAEARS